MRNPIGYLALSLLAAAFAGCSSTDTGTTSTSSTSNGDLTGALAKYNAKLVPLAAAPEFATGKLTVDLAAGEIVVVSLRSIDSAVLVNGKEKLTQDSKTKAMVPVTSKLMTSLEVNGDESGAETLILDVRNGLFATGAIVVDLKGDDTGGATEGDEVAVLGSTGADKMACLVGSSIDNIDFNADGKADIKPTIPASGPANHFTVDLNDGADTFNQSACTTAMSVYGSAGADTITVGSVTTTIGDVFSGGTDGTTAESVDTITYAARTSGVTVTLNGSVATPTGSDDDGDGDGSVEKDNVLNDFETVVGSAGDDVLTAGILAVTATSGTKPTTYTLNGGAGKDKLASKQNFGTVFIGGDGVDTVDYSARGVGVTITMDGKALDDGERNTAVGVLANATLDNVGADIENVIGTDYADKVTGNGLNNWFRPGDGADIVVGGDGDDIMVSGRAGGADNTDGDDIFQGGLGNDTVDYSNRAGATKHMTINLDCTFATATVATIARTLGTATKTTGGSESDSIGLDVENAVGSMGNDTINGNASPNSIWGLGGNDTIDGKAGNDLLDANPYTGGLLTPNGYQCDGALLACLDADGSTPASQPDDCDCLTVSGFKCLAADDTNCADPVTGLILADQTGCDCDTIPGSAGAVMVTCNPATGVILVASTEALSTNATCAANSYVAGACSGTASIVCGGDSMDIASCKDDADGSQESGCWKKQL